jgi:hypothetical protein
VRLGTCPIGDAVTEFHLASMRAREPQEYYVANNKNPNQRRPGEKEPGTFHYNPGNMSGKTVGGHKDDADQQSNNADTIHSRNEEQQNKTNK